MLIDFRLVDASLVVLVLVEVVLGRGSEVGHHRQNFIFIFEELTKVALGFDLIECYLCLTSKTNLIRH